MSRLIDRRAVLGAGLVVGLMAEPTHAFATPTRFLHGVASGDPTQDGVIIWTRLSGGGTLSGRWFVAEDPAFTRIVISGDFQTSPDRDQTVKIEVEGLKPGRKYRYRFEILGETSPTGQTSTLPDGQIDELNLVVACCAMYAAGYFPAYKLIAQREKLDAVLFLGDYIYEYGGSPFPGLDILRQPDPPRDIVTLDDYRRRFAQSRADPSLQAAHARAPWICAWDDHEIANDDWMGGAQHHDPVVDGDWTARKAAAVQAYYEWMPIRDPDSSAPYDIQRTLKFGNLATLILPETRLKARQRPLSLTRDLDFIYLDVSDPAKPIPIGNGLALPKPLPSHLKGVPDVEGFRQKMADSSRTLIGQAQMDTLHKDVQASVDAGQPWVLIGSPTIMATYNYPDLAPWLDQMMHASGGALSALKPLIDLTQYHLPLFNLDSWDGYDAERRQIYNILRQTGARAIVLSGDSHMAWVNDLHDDKGIVALEISTSTLTGPSMGLGLGLKEAPLGQAFVHENRDIRWCDHLATGFVTVCLRHDNVRADFINIDTLQTDGSLPVTIKTVCANQQSVDGWRGL